MVSDVKKMEKIFGGYVKPGKKRKRMFIIKKKKKR